MKFALLLSDIPSLPSSEQTRYAHLQPDLSEWGIVSNNNAQTPVSVAGDYMQLWRSAVKIVIARFAPRLSRNRS